MSGFFRKASGTALAFALTAPAAWADSAASNTAGGGGAAFQGPGWNGYGPGPWMMGGWGGGMPMMGYGGWGGYGEGDGS